MNLPPNLVEFTMKQGFTMSINVNSRKKHLIKSINWPSQIFVVLVLPHGNDLPSVTKVLFWQVIKLNTHLVGSICLFHVKEEMVRLANI